MRKLLFLLLLTAAGCNSNVCGTGTIDRNGMCEPSSETVDPGKCGPFTELQGDKCVPMFPPTECDPATTTPSTDPATGVTTCIGNGMGGGCGGTFACPTPATGKQTICGQIYDFEDNSPFQVTGTPTGGMCSAPTATGPCSLSIKPYDAIAFATNPSTAQPLANGGVYIDDCGRYRVTDITVPSGPFIGLGIDDASGMGPTGTTVTVGIATADDPGNATKDLEGWILKMSTTAMWETTGGPPLSGGYYIPVYRQHSLKSGMDRFAPQAGVTFTKSGATESANDFYFAPGETTRQNIAGAASQTGANGTAIVNNATIMDSLAYSGTGGISDTTNCKWETKAGASLPFIAFIQVFRPMNQIGKTCPL